MGDATGALIVLLLFVCALGAIVASIASKKGRSAIGWFFFGALFFIPALVTALLLKPSRDHEVNMWVRGGGRLCEECREPVNPGAIRCHHCGVKQSERAPEGWEPEYAPTASNTAVEFFAGELKGVASASLLGRDQTMDERALLGPIGGTNRLSSDRALRRCQELVDMAMEMAAETSGWSAVDEVRMPRTWVEPYEVLASLDDDSPALIAFIERSGHGGSTRDALPAPNPSSSGEAEIAYDIGDWDAREFARITAALDGERVAWYLDDNDLVVDARSEILADALIADVTGGQPREATELPAPLPPPDLAAKPTPSSQTPFEK